MSTRWTRHGRCGPNWALASTIGSGTVRRVWGWNVVHVYAHHSAFPAAAAGAVEAPPDAAAVTHADAAELLAFMQKPGGLADTVKDDLRRNAIDFANTHSTAELVENFTTTAPRLIATLRDADLTRAIDYGGTAVIAMGEALRIAVLEAVVHYFDMATALDLPVPGPMAGEPTATTVRLLAELADPITLIDSATGRGAPPVFPVLR